MLNKANIFCTVIKRSFLFILISFSLVYTQDPPPEFEFNISIYQSFYFFLEANIDGENLVEGEDWIASFSVYDETMGGQCSYIDEDLDGEPSTLDCYDVNEDGILSEEIEISIMEAKSLVDTAISIIKPLKIDYDKLKEEILAFVVINIFSLICKL